MVVTSVACLPSLARPVYLRRMVVYAKQLYTPPRLTTMTGRMNSPSGGELMSDQMLTSTKGHHWKMKMTTKIIIILAEFLYRSAFASLAARDLLSLIRIPPYATATTPNTRISAIVETSAYTFPARVRRSMRHLDIKQMIFLSF